MARKKRCRIVVQEVATSSESEEEAETEQQQQQQPGFGSEPSAEAKEAAGSGSSEEDVDEDTVGAAPPAAGAPIDCVATVVPASDEAAIQGVLTRRGEFGELEDTSDQRQEEFRAAVEDCDSMSFAQAKGARDWALKEKAMRTNWKIQKNAQRMVTQWHGGASAVALSRQHDLPPVAILRQVLEKRLGGREAARRGMKDPHGTLTAREIEELAAAAAVDNINLLAQSPKSLLQQEEADRFEADLQSLLEPTGVSFTTQEELVAEQTAAIGRPVSTPDFLLQKDQQRLMVNGQPVQWLEAKNFYGCGWCVILRPFHSYFRHFLELIFWGKSGTAR